MSNSKRIFNPDKPVYSKNCNNQHTCKKNFNHNTLDSLFCVENFLCNSQKFYYLYRLFCFFK